ncbi:MAG: hypothetical protein M3R72_10790 [Bacteroidota bacterium]|nr:hypothetical protein [Bacteroidota bacterium]
MTINIIGREKEPLTLNDIYTAWYGLKKRYTDAIVLLRNGDLYFSFEGDADAINGIMQKEPLPQWKERQMCRLPFYHIDEFLHRIVKAGYRAAICEPFSLAQQ